MSCPEADEVHGDPRAGVLRDGRLGYEAG